jgi:hypothetical protein
MVAKMTVPNSIKSALNYNEQKMKEGVAECIYAHNFLKEAEQLNFYEKINRFEKLIALNRRASTNTVHISLNFGLNEKIEKGKLIEIAFDYMEKIGFAEQPYLVYQHLDAGHPHIHIVTTNIQNDGRRISLHNLGRNESTKARKEIEIAYNLVKAEEQKKQHSDEIKPINAQRLNYGKSPTKRGITNVLDAVLTKYKYASLPELNAVLKLYNLVADRGKEDGIIFKRGGLVYRALDERGNKVGVPVKASSIYNKPTLSYLEKRFEENELLKKEFRKNLRTSIDWIMLKSPKSLEAFKQALQKEKINLVVRQNDNGIIYGLTYIDHNTKCVFNGSDIGKDYSAKAILEKCGIAQSYSANQKVSELKLSQPDKPELFDEFSKSHYPDLTQIVDDAIMPSEEIHYLPYELKKRKRKRRKK